MSPRIALVAALLLTAQPLAAWGTAGPASRSSPSDSVPGDARAPEWFGGRSWWSWTAMTGDWGGGRKALRSLGLDVGAGTVAEAGASAEGAAGLQRTELVVAVEASWIRGLVQLHAKTGREGVSGFDPLHGLSGEDAADFAGLGEAWLEVGGAGAGVRVRAGRLDANAEFAAGPAAGSFANPAFGLGPAVDQLPSHPAPAAGASGFAAVAPGMEAGVGVFVRAAGGAVAVGQLTGGRAEEPGAWWAVGGVAGVDRAGGPSALESVYAMVESRAESGIAAFISVAGSFAGASAARHLAAGVTAPIPGPGSPSAGVAGSWLRAVEGSGAGELLLEAFVRIEALPWLTLQPDLQLGAPLDGSSRPRLAGLLRAELSY